MLTGEVGLQSRRPLEATPPSLWHRQDTELFDPDNW